MNILILSAGTRNKVIEYFVKEVSDSGNIVATDMSPLAPAIYSANKHYIVGKITSHNYIDSIIDICKRENISGVLSLIDPELSLLSQNEKRFQAIGVKVIGSSYELCQLSLDKYQMYTWLKKHNYKCARSYTSKKAFYRDLNSGKITFPVILKPVRGSASISVAKVDNRESLEFLLAGNNNLIIQEYLHGVEIGADVYIDLISGEIVSIFTKKKIKMRSGETDKAVSFIDEKLYDLIKKFVNEAGYRGEIDIDLFEIAGEYFISEVNPRFGGGYPFAYECGCNHVKYIINNIEGKTNRANIGNYKDNVFMMKYSEIYVNRDSEKTRKDDTSEL